MTVSSHLYTPDNPYTGKLQWFEADVHFRGFQRLYTGSELIDNRDSSQPIRTENNKVDVIALKCFLILIGMPFYTTAVMAVHVIRSFTLVSTNLVKGELSEAFLSLVQQVWAVAKAPFYGLAILFFAILGMYFPLENRSMIAHLEREWSGSERFYDLRRMKTRKEFVDAIYDFFINRKSKKTIFNAFCFQPLGELNDSKWVINYRVYD